MGESPPVDLRESLVQSEPNPSERAIALARWSCFVPQRRCHRVGLSRLFDCLKSMVGRKVLGRPPERPWMPYEAIASLRSELSPGDRVFEWGGGGSTVWLRSLGCTVHSIEHEPGWARRLNEHMRELGLEDRGTLTFREPETASGDEGFGSERPEYANMSFRRYIDEIRSYPDGHFRLVSVDGRARPACLEAGAAKVAPGGLLLLDDSDREHYRGSIELLRSWRRRDYTGLQPYTLRPGFTTIWRKPA